MTVEARTGIGAGQRQVLLDLMRGIAALLVFVGHLRGGAFVEFAALPPDQRTLPAAAFFASTRLGHEAVLVFFVLSGYFVGGALLRRIGAGSFDAMGYVLDRTTRILVPLVPAVVVTVLVVWAVGMPVPATTTVLANLTGLNGVVAPTLEGNVALWSLAYEIWFYVLAGGLACLVTRSGNFPLAALAAIVAAAVFGVLDARYLAFWAVGALTIHLEGNRWRGWLATCGSLLAVAGTAAHQLGVASKSTFIASPISPASAEVMIAVGVALTLPQLVCWSSRIANSKLRTAATRLADVSYSLYLFHIPLLLVLDIPFPKQASLDAASLASFVLKGSLAFIGCIVLYAAFEARTGRIRRRLRSWLQSRGGLRASSGVALNSSPTRE